MQRVDVIIFGASGYTGQYLVQHLASTFQDEKIEWAIAGRSKSKLQEVLKAVSVLKSKAITQLNKKEINLINL